jgi:DNA-binding GntR family transcriptional regulator
VALALQNTLISRSRRSVIADTIRQQILNGELRPGQLVRLRDVADSFGVSVSPVRDAFLSLADEGLVRIQTRKGIEILTLSPVDIRDLFRVYAYVSGLFAERAAELVSDEQLTELQSLVEEMDATDDQQEVETLNWRFHRLINHMSPTIYLPSIARMLARNIPRKYFSVIPGRQVTAQADHRRLVLALQTRDAAASREIAEQHIRTAGEMVVRHLEQIGYWDSVQPASADGLRPTHRD